MLIQSISKRSLLLGTSLPFLYLPQTLFAQTVIITPQDNIDEIVVSGHMTQKPALSTSVPKETNGRPFADAGDYLRRIPGVSSGRMGGHALEPVIRGQSRSQLNIINDGAVIEGAGPNRMDTPASFSDIDTADKITVHRGYQSVQYGAGGNGGTIIIEHNPPTFTEKDNFKGQLNGAYESNGDIWSTAGNLVTHTDKLYLRLNTHFKDAGNYKDGNDNEVRSSFRSYGGSIEIGYRDEFTWANIGISHEETRDTLFPGAGMDSPKGSGTTIRGKIKHDFNSSQFIKSIELDIYRSRAFHLMNNFSFRDIMMMFRQSDLEAITTGGKIAAKLDVKDSDVTVGFDIKNVNHDGYRMGNNMDRDNLNLIQSILLPDATIQNIGLFAEGYIPLSANVQIKAGLRYDYVKSSAGNADLKNNLVMMGMMPMSANMLYHNYYGSMAMDQVDNNMGGLLRLEYDIKEDITFYAGISQSKRSANSVERYMASLMGNAILPSGDVINQSWIGNPNLAPEKHIQFDAGFGVHKADWHFLATAYYDNINDYIFRDRAHGQDGILLTNNALIYRNIEARIWGFEIEASGNINENLKLFGHISYTHGQNQTLHIPLYQIPPFSYDLTVSYEKDIWTIGGRLFGAFKQSRIDTDPLIASGRDAGETEDYIAMDIFGAMSILDNSKIRFGVSNLFDKLYANHLNRESLNDATSIRVNEPGRSFYVRLESKF
ncbi:MAG: TonB-dependent receptor [Emcibacter sp.]|nr:TonB-dependent receptor [Emcibacter sp.]